MALTRDEKTSVLAMLLRKDHETFARFVQDTKNLNKDTKIELLTMHVQLVYGDDLDAIHKMVKVITEGDTP